MAKQNNINIFHGGLTSLMKEHWQTDVKLKGGDSDTDANISAHKIILAARSMVFKKMLEQDECKTSSAEEIITLSEMKHEEVEALVQFIYVPHFLSSLEGIKKHARSLYLAADKYEIPYLRDLCRNELIASLNLTNALDVLALAQIPFDDALNVAAISYITENISEIVNSEEFKLFAASYPNSTVEIVKASLDRNINIEVKCYRCSRLLDNPVCKQCYTSYDYY